MHEDLKREEEVKGSSDKSFGLVFGTLFALIAFSPLLHQPAGPIRVWALAVSAAFFALALFWTAPLRPLNWLWLRFGLILHAIVSPLIMGMLFYLTVTPLGLFMRFRGNDLLRLRRDPAAKSYWIERQPPGPAADTMKNQF